MGQMRYRGSLATLLMALVVGCATPRTVHWQKDPVGAASRVAELSSDNTATIKATDGAEFRGRGVVLTPDSVRWTRISDQTPDGMPLADVASIEVVTGRHGKEGALIGGIVGVASVALGALRCSDCGTVGSGLLLVYYGVPAGAVGALLGALIGTSNADKFIFVREDH